MALIQLLLAFYTNFQLGSSDRKFAFVSNWMQTSKAKPVVAIYEAVGELTEFAAGRWNDPIFVLYENGTALYKVRGQRDGYVERKLTRKEIRDVKSNSENIALDSRENWSSKRPKARSVVLGFWIPKKPLHRYFQQMSKLEWSNRMYSSDLPDNALALMKCVDNIRCGVGARRIFPESISYTRGWSAIGGSPFMLSWFPLAPQKPGGTCSRGIIGDMAFFLYEFRTSRLPEEIKDYVSQHEFVSIGNELEASVGWRHCLPGEEAWIEEVKLWPCSQH